MENIFKDKVILITGSVGTVGAELLRYPNQDFLRAGALYAKESGGDNVLIFDPFPISHFLDDWKPDQPNKLIPQE